MFDRRFFILFALVASMFLLFSSPAFSADKASQCSSKASGAIADLDKWIGEYERQMNAAEPVQKPKYQEWLRELNKLKKLVKKAQNQLGDKEKCSSPECVADQCNLIDIADQQVAQLIKETEEQLGASTRFGEEAGREVILDPDTLGDDEALPGYDPNDASDPSYSDKSDQSDGQTAGNIGDVSDGSIDPDNSLPPEPATQNASDQ